MAWTLVVLAIGVLLIPPLLSRISTNLLASRAIEEGLKEQYAADSGVEYALLQLQNGVLAGQNNYAINNKEVSVTWGEYISETYKITSTATSHVDGSSTTIESYVGTAIISPAVFDHAAVALGSDKECDIDFGGSSLIESDVTLGGDVHANGNVCLIGNQAYIDGDASATEEIDDKHEGIAGVKKEDAPPLTAPDIDILAYKAEAEAVDCGDVTPGNLMINSAEDYDDLEYPLYVGGSLDISADGTFAGAVCVTGNLNIDAEVTFDGPVKVGGDLDIV